MLLEKDIMKYVGQRLRLYQMTGEVIWFTRLNSGKVRVNGYYIQLCDPGTPDYVCAIRNRKLGISLLFFECKSDTGKLSKDQENFRDTYSQVKDVGYFEIRNPNDFDVIILDIAKDMVLDIPSSL